MDPLLRYMPTVFLSRAGFSTSTLANREVNVCMCVWVFACHECFAKQVSDELRKKNSSLSAQLNAAAATAAAAAAAAAAAEADAASSPRKDEGSAPPSPRRHLRPSTSAEEKVRSARSRRLSPTREKNTRERGRVCYRKKPGRHRRNFLALEAGFRGILAVFSMQWRDVGPYVLQTRCAWSLGHRPRTFRRADN